MAQLDNILDLVRTVNEVYFITAPTRTRAVFLLIDDIVELTLKSYLQYFSEEERTRCMIELNKNNIIPKDKHRSLQSYFESHLSLAQLASEWNQTSQVLEGILYKHRHLRKLKLHAEDSRTGFDDVIKETKNCFVCQKQLEDLLNKILSRHKLRNKLYHNQNALAWAIDNKQCLEALQELYELIYFLFPDASKEILSEAKHYLTRCQMRVIHFLAKISGNETYEDVYRKGIMESASRSAHKLKKDVDKLNYSMLHTDYNNFISAFYEYLLLFTVKERQDMNKKGYDLVNVNNLSASVRNRLKRVEFLEQEAENFRILTEEQQ